MRVGKIQFGSRPLVAIQPLLLLLVCVSSKPSGPRAAAVETAGANQAQRIRTPAIQGYPSLIYKEQQEERRRPPAAKAHSIEDVRLAAESGAPISIGSLLDYMSPPNDGRQPLDSRRAAAAVGPTNGHQRQHQQHRQHQLEAAEDDSLAAPNTLFEQPLAMGGQVGAPMLAGFYLNGLAGQQAALFPAAPQVLRAAAPQYAGAASDAYGAQNQQNLYAQQQQQQQQVQNYFHPAATIGQQAASLLAINPATYYAPQTSAFGSVIADEHEHEGGPAGGMRKAASSSQRNSKSRRQQQQQPELERPSKRQQQQQQMLSDSQLNSLIDELKEFNRRQEKSIESRGLAAPRNNRKSPSGAESEAVESGGDDDTELGPFLSRLEEALDQQESEERGQKEESPPSAEDLAKFARFLMTKEGANMRFQLGLDKDSPDDGDGDDEDERDQLLESQRGGSAKRKAGLAGATGSGSGRRAKLESFDRHHSTVAKQMSRLLEEVSKKQKQKQRPKGELRGAEQEEAAAGQGSSGGDSSEGRPGEEGGERARRRRDQVAAIQQPQPEAPKKPRMTTSTGKENNFAKSLMERELVEDKLESAKDLPPLPLRFEGAVVTGGGGAGAGSLPAASSIDDRRLAEPSAIQGEANARKKASEGDSLSDGGRLVNELQRTRALKSDTRSRLPVGALNSALAKALDGGLAVRAAVQVSPGANSLVGPRKLEVRDSNDRPMATLQLFRTLSSPNSTQEGPTKTEATTATTTTGGGGGASASPADVGSINSELAPALIEPDQGRRSMAAGSLSSKEGAVQRVQSEPVKDEYPISEKVSERLNKLSHNLDRYFNDGFLAEIEAKSLGDGGSGSGGGSEMSADGDPRRRPQSAKGKARANGNAAASPTSAPTVAPKVEDMKVDHDFDVDVSIDGRRDVEPADRASLLSGQTGEEGEEDDEEDDESGRDEDESRTAEADSNERSRKSQATAKGNKRASGNGNNEQTGAKKLKEHSNQLDPVESELLETPIGPD